jgi:type II secretory pathway component GspD/PulD (secretin)
MQQPNTAMKTTINTLFATILITLTASASPALLVETTITEHHAKGGKDVLAAPSITVESGKQAIIQVGKLEYAVTPTLLDDGTVDLRAVLTERDGKNADRLAAPQIKSELGQVAEIQIGQLAFTTKTSLAK